MSERIIVTGAAGFIGSSLIEKLIKKDYEIIGIDYVKKPIKLGQFINNIDYFSININNVNAIRRIIEDTRPDGVVHLAAVSRVAWCEHNIYGCVETNINGTLNILKAMQTIDKKPWLIYSSSREVYGEPEKLPVKENDPKRPINIYGYTKLIGEKIVMDQSLKNHFSSIILRFSNIYGNEKDIYDRVIPQFIIRALKGLPLEIYGGNQVFDFTYIDDAIDGIIKSIEKLITINFIVDDYNILTGKPTPLRMLPVYISEIIGREVKIVYKPARNYNVKRFYGDPSKAREELDFIARVSIKDGLRRTIERFRGIII